MAVKENCSADIVDEMRRETIWAICLKMQKLVPDKLVVLKDIQNDGLADNGAMQSHIEGFGVYQEKVNLGPVNIFGWRPFKKIRHHLFCYLDIRGSMNKIFLKIDDQRFYQVVKQEADNLATRFKNITKEEVSVEITRNYT